MSQSEIKVDSSEFAQAIEKAEPGKKEGGPLRGYGFLLFVTAGLFVAWNVIRGPVFDEFTPASEIREEVSAEMPEWYDNLFEPLVSQEEVVLNFRFQMGVNREVRFEKLHNPDRFIVPTAWVEQVGNTPEITADEIRKLKELANSEDLFTTTMAARWLLEVGERVEREQVASELASQREAFERLGQQ